MTRREHLFICLLEECSEVSKEVSKILRFGEQDHAPKDELRSNLEKLSDEVVDMLSVLDMLNEDGLDLELFKDANEDKLEEAVAKKKEKVEKYIQYALGKGTIKP
jgi:NTP pyrophosphatase (non-canonical NTP hydrolase)